MILTPRRLMVVGSVIADVMVQVPDLPRRGNDVLATERRVQAGGGFNAATAATRLGLPAVLAGHLGTGALAQLVAEELTREGIDVLLPRLDGEQGFCVGMVEPDGERTFITAPGVESALTEAALAQVELQPGDVILVSGYDLLYPVTGPAVAAWLHGPADRPDVMMVLDPGPLVASIPTAVREKVLARADILSSTVSELALLTGAPASGTADSGTALPDGVRLPEGLRADAVVLLRDGARGTTLIRPGTAPVHLPAPVVTDVIDTTGAGDTHCGAFLAELSRGADLLSATRVANAAAAESVRRPVSAGCPTRDELDLLIGS